MFKEIELKTEDGVKIKANYHKKENDCAVIIAPGWCMTKDSKAFRQLAERFAECFDVLSIDFRGHGKSSGFFTFSAKEFFDIKAAVDFLKPNYREVYITGFSLGAASALIYEGSTVELGFSPVDKIIAISPPDEFNKIENQMWKKEAWGETFKKTFGRESEKLEFLRFFSIRPSIVPHKKIKPICVVDKINVPTLFIAGKKDPTVHFHHTVKLFSEAKCKKDLKLYDEGIHAEDIFLHFEEDFIQTCKEWLLKA